MFWEKWIPKKYVLKPAVCGIEVLITDNGLQFDGVILKANGNTLTLSDAFSLSQKPVLPEQVKKKKMPVLLAISGKGIINKKITLPEGALPALDELVAQHLPTLQADEFYRQLHVQENGTAFIAIIRKAQLDPILDLFAQNKVELAGLLIGPAFVSAVGPIAASLSRLQAQAYTLELANNSVDTILEPGQQETPALNLEGLLISKPQVLAFAAAFMYLAHALDQDVSDASLQLYYQRHVEANKFRVLSYAFIGLAFALCLLNFFVFNSFFGKSKQLESELGVYQGKYEQINELLSRYEKQKGLIEQAGILNANTIAEFSDKIAATVPEEVTLVEWLFNPVKGDVEEDSLMHFKSNTIVIKGNCNKSLIVNEWLNVLKSQNFISDINLEKFAFNSEGTQPNFELKIITD